MQFTRSSGVLLHPTSLPGRYGIGDLGPSAYRFIDFLASSKQSFWQLLPLGPTGYGDSPYQSFSAFAGNPLLLSPDRLAADGYLPQEALGDIPTFPANRVDYGRVIPYKEQLLRQAFAGFQANSGQATQEAFHAFCSDNTHWLEDFALFMTFKTRYLHQDGGVWTSWPEEIARRDTAALKRWSHVLADEIAYHKFLQFAFVRQWQALKQYARERGIRIIGDAPIFVAFDSADVWANPELFFLQEDGLASVVAGVPPDYFSKTGQRWGNPLYRWDVLEADGYAWWARRLRAVLSMLDIVRLDHFRGFEAYWEIPAAEPTAVIGRWVKGPGAAFFRAMKTALGDLPFIAEDLGVITPEVVRLRDEFQLPGMKILQFAFGGERNSSFLPHNFTAHCVVYPGTHDNETALGWYRNAAPEEQDHFRRYTATDGHDVSWDMIRLALASVANTAIAPMQDLMKLGNEARMNRPSTASGNWQWRYTDAMLTDEIIRRLGELTVLYGRTPAEET